MDTTTDELLWVTEAEYSDGYKLLFMMIFKTKYSYCEKKKDSTKKTATESGFTQAEVYAHRQFCANLEVYRSPKPLWNNRLWEAATMY